MSSKTEYTIDAPMPPLWLAFPYISKYSIGWRMGVGEEYKYEFYDWFSTLTADEQSIYNSLFPQPITWSDNGDTEDDNTEFIPPGFDTDKFVYIWRKEGKPEYSIDELESDYKQGKRLPFLFFWGHTPPKDGVVNQSCFSQWFPSSFNIDTDSYSSMEQYMMAEKARLFDDDKILEQIKVTQDPSKVKKLGRQVKNFDNRVWDRYKYSIILNGSYAKYAQNENMRDFLLSTNNKVLVEASPYDSVWGIKMSAGDPNVDNPLKWKGSNLLGFALMEVRNELRKAYQNYHKINWDKFFSDYRDHI